jgi:predicted metal-dependent hydrolase
MTATNVEHSSVRYGNKVIDYAIRRSARRTTVSIAIDTTDGVLVTAPEPAPIARLDRIVHAKAAWICQRLKRQSDGPPAPSTKEFVSGESFRYLGRQYRLRVERADKPRPVRLERGWLRVVAPRGLDERHRAAHVRTALVEWYGARAKERLPARVAIWAKKLQMTPPAVTVADPQKRWGSASVAGTAIRLNWRVIQSPLSLVDYVVAHELTHLEHPNHTAKFWAALGRAMPDYDARKAKLSRLGVEFAW